MTATILAAGTTSPASAQGPLIERGSEQVTFADDFILDLCGIETDTTLTPRWSTKTNLDGSEVVQVVRTFVPADSRIPVEKGAATNFIAADGTSRVVGKPIQLFGRNGVILIDAGTIEFDPRGEISTVRGPHPSVTADLAQYYCPS